MMEQANKDFLKDFKIDVTLIDNYSLHFDNKIILATEYHQTWLQRLLLRLLRREARQ